MRGGDSEAQVPPAGWQPFRYGPHPAQVADLALPDAALSDGALPDGALPDGEAGAVGGVVISIHGGFWRARYDRSLEHAVAADLLTRGWAVWNIDYRGVGGGGGWPETFMDVATAVDLLAQVAPSRGLSLDRVAVLGHSAGGAMALWAAGRHRLPDGAPGARPQMRPNAVVAQAAVCDLAAAARERLGTGAVRDLMGAGPDEAPARYHLASPAALLPLGVPILLVTGDADDDVPAEQSSVFACRAQEAGDDVTLAVVPGEGHYGHLDPRSPLWQLVVTWLDKRVGSRDEREDGWPI